MTAEQQRMTGREFQDADTPAKMALAPAGAISGAVW